MIDEAPQEVASEGTRGLVALLPGGQEIDPTGDRTEPDVDAVVGVGGVPSLEALPQAALRAFEQDDDALPGVVGEVVDDGPSRSPQGCNNPRPARLRPS